MKEERKRMLFHYQSMEGIGYKSLVKLLKYVGAENTDKGQPEYEALAELCKLSEDALVSLIGKSKTKAFLVGERAKEESFKAYDDMKKKHITYLSLWEEAFPDKLRQIYDPPLGLFCYGKLPEKDSLNVAVIGARICSEYGKYVAKEYARILAKGGCGIVSGMAFGIDSVGQLSALDAGGYSLGVLGCGVDICYPKENILLHERLKKEGGIISEYPPGTMPKKTYFPMRNRIISALSDAVLVVEAREKSGTLITADRALEQGKDVYAVPGRVTDALSYGCNRLIFQGAFVALSPQEVLADILKQKVTITNELCKPKGEGEACVHDDVLRVIDVTPCSMQEWYEKYKAFSGEDMGIAAFSVKVFRLVIDKKVKQIEGSGCYCKVF